MHRTAYILLTLTTLIWGANAIAGKLAVGHVSPMILTAARWGFAAIVLAMFGWRHLARDWPVIRPHLPLLAGLGAIGFTGFNIFLYHALLYTSAINVSIEQTGIPLVIFLVNFIFFRLRVTILQMAGFALTMVGVALTVTHGEPSRLLELDINLGDALMVGGVLLYAIYSVGLRFKPDIHWMSLMIVLCGTSFVVSIPFALGEFAAGTAIPPDARGWAIILFTVIGPSIVSQVMYIRGVELIGANRAGLFINLIPVFGTLLSILLLGESLHLYHVAALLLALGGIAIAEWSGRRTAG